MCAFISCFNVFTLYLACPPGTHKADVGNGQCIPCPVHSEQAQGGIGCQCKERFYRAPEQACSSKYLFIHNPNPTLTKCLEMLLPLWTIMEGTIKGNVRFKDLEELYRGGLVHNS